MNTGYTKVSNSILQALSHVSVPAGVKDIYLLLLRLTSGWQRREKVISYNDLSLLTGYHHWNISRYVKRALDAGMLSRYKIGTTLPRYCYAPVLDPHKWKVPWRIKPRDFSTLLTKLASAGRLTERSAGRLTHLSANRLTDLLGIIIDTPIK